MDTVQLGAGFGGKRSSLDGFAAALKDSIADELRNEVVAPLLKQVAMLMREAQGRPPSVEVKAPNVQVSPKFDVNVPDIEIPDLDLTLTLPGMDRVEAKLSSIDSKLGELITLLGKPVEKTVSRGAGGQIDKVTEKRG